MQSQVNSDFKKHWSCHKSQKISIAKIAEAKSFLKPLFSFQDESGQKIKILDVGCGDGVHSIALAQNDIESLYYCGVDISFEAVKVACKRIRELDRKNFDFQAGNVFSLPYRSDSFDVVFSYGVIAYTGMPQMAVNEMIRISKPGGLIGIWLYPKRGGILGAAFSLTRLFCRSLGKYSKIIIYIMIPLLYFLPVRSGVNLSNSTWNQCAEVIEVNLLPKTLEFYTLNDVLSWFNSRPIEVTSIDHSRPITVWARVKK
jgi:ubiquinone/menaquinone biosynthesis C-methylase UbiE